MLSYIVKRVFTALLTMLCIIAITFFLMNAIPGSPFITEKSTPAMIAMAEAKYGLDKPLIIQFFNYVKGYFVGDMGVSLKMQEGTPVTKIIFEQGKFALSCRLGIVAAILAVLVGVPLGCLAAYNRENAVDSVLRVLTTIGVAVPSFVLNSLMLIFLCVKFKWFPVISGSLETWKAYVCPVIGLSFYSTCYIAKLTRTSMLDAINQDYIRTARAKGLKTGKIIFKHALRNSLIPVITYIGPMTAGLVTGGFVVEQTFQIPGIAKYFISSITNRDYPIIMGTTVLLSALVVFMNLLVDIVYKFVDPRINVAREE